MHPLNRDKLNNNSFIVLFILLMDLRYAIKLVCHQKGLPDVSYLLMQMLSLSIICYQV